MTDRPTPDPSQITTYFREMLEKSERFEVQVLVASAGVYDPEKRQFNIHVGIGALEGVTTLPPQQRQMALRAVLTGLREAERRVKEAMDLGEGIQPS